MNKFLLLIFLLISPLAVADMDYTCKTTFSSKMDEYIELYCERNNILVLRNIPKVSIIEMIAFWCRQDREINYYLIPEPVSRLNLSCVLYDNKPRKPVQAK